MESGLLLFCSSVAILLLLAIGKWNRNKISGNALYTIWKMVLLQMIPFSIPVWVRSSVPYSSGIKFSAGSCLMTIYLVIAGVLLLIGLFSFLRTERYIHHLPVLSRSDSRGFGLTKNITVLESDHIAFPFSFGIFKHYIALPNWAVADEEMLLCIIQHERIHIERRDCLWKVLAYIFCSLYWYNPFMWCLYGQLGRQCELSCDELALKQLGEDNRSIYLKAIVYCCEQSCHSGPVSKVIQPFGSNSNFVKERIDAMMREKKKNRFIVAGIVIAVSMICVFGHFKFQRSEASAEKILTTNDGTGIEADSSATYEKVDLNDNTSVTVIKHSESER